MPRSEFSGLFTRARLTLQHHGPMTLLTRALAFPLRFTPLRRLAPSSRDAARDRQAALAWYRHHAVPVEVVRLSMPARSGSPATDPERDLLFLADGVRVDEAALAALQYRAHHSPSPALIVPRLLSADRRTIVSSGLERDPDRSGALHQRDRNRPSDWGPAGTRGPVLGATHAVYLTHTAVQSLQLRDSSRESGPPAEDTNLLDLCRRAWETGYGVMYEPDASAWLAAGVPAPAEPSAQSDFTVRPQLPSATPPSSTAETGRLVRPERLPIIYVMKDTRMGGGQRVILEHLNRLHARGHDVALWTLDAPPEWFSLRAPVRGFADLDDLIAALSPVEAVKVATWWETADAVWAASVQHGRPVYLVQDIETSYYPDDEISRHAVLATYRPEFRYLAGSGWIRDRLADLGRAATLLAPGIDLDTFRPLPDVERETNLVVALGRSAPIKNFALTRQAWQSMSSAGPRMELFGTEPDLTSGLRNATYLTAPDDSTVNRLLNRATVFLQTSRHEGFCLPLLEAMATGCPVICTDARGNRDFCVGEHNCLMVEPTPEAVAGAITRLLSDSDLRNRLSGAAADTARACAWTSRIDTLERFLIGVSEESSTLAVTQTRRDGPRS